MRNLVIAAALTLGVVTLPAAADAGEAFQVGVRPSATTLVLGQTLTFTGWVRPGAPAAGQKIELQEKYARGKPWKTQDTARVGRSGRYQLTDEPTTATIRKYRVVLPAVAHHSEGLSKQLTISVYGWSRLAGHQSVNDTEFDPSTPVDIDGVAYPASLHAQVGGPASIEYNLDHLCTELRATYGLSDASETGAQATVSLAADGTQLYSHTFGLGQSEFSDVALDRPLKIRFAAQSASTDVNGYGAIGTPKVLCTAPYAG